MRNLLIAAFLLTISAACTVGPDYERPEVYTPADWTVSYKAATALIDTAWWRQFNDPVLDDLIATAITNNLDLRAAMARVDQFLGQLRTTRSEFFPQIGYSGSAFRQDDTDTGLSPPRGEYSDYQGLISASWELDLWGRIRRSNEAARAELLASEAGRRSVLLSLVTNVASNYIILRGLDRQLEISIETADTYRDSLRIFNYRHTYGTVSQVEVSQVESEYEDALQTIPEIESQIIQQQHLLSVLLGQNPGPISRGNTISQLTVPAIPAGLPAELLEQRPDIIQAEQQLIAANARIGVAKSLYFPTISLTGAFGQSSIDSDRLFDSDSAIWQIGGDILGPIFTFGDIEGQVMTSEAAQQEALYNYRQSILSAFREVEDALIATTKGRERQEAQGRRTRTLETYSRLAKYQYDAGTTSYLQVLDANRSLFSSQLDYVQNQTSTLVSLIDVYRALGGGWVNVADDMLQDSDPVADADLP
ncbi:efflux transporter outer membrane subunit [Desulfosediminicola ganghwensis]|uniref:efflux transporter outer membrane subunit n=1 Tax=Desulfosediminicola ganghwensis TaxID=2569540 RepID=UPI0010ACF84B|nr:efflux transporter outer membrane subunit [Desulfosediminicola ganghwensis]